jgi:hypothetical protein
MMPGRNRVYGCPSCGQKVIVGSLGSGNNIGAILYSDGMQFAPMLPEYPRETKCKECGIIFEFNNRTLLKLLACELSWEPNCNDAIFLTVKDYKEKIDLNQGDEKQNRLMMWHTANGTYGGHGISTDTDLYIDNCKKLISLLKDSQDAYGKITLAELYRNIGNFESCVKIVSSLNNDMDWLKNSYFEQCAVQNTKTFILREMN